MTKIKIFSMNDAYTLEEMVNRFIHDKKIVDIKYAPLVRNDRAYDRVLVIYEEDDERENAYGTE